jgi:hypothetical protein
MKYFIPIGSLFQICWLIQSNFLCKECRQVPNDAHLHKRVAAQVNCVVLVLTTCNVGGIIGTEIFSQFEEFDAYEWELACNMSVGMARNLSNLHISIHFQETISAKETLERGRTWHPARR